MIRWNAARYHRGDQAGDREARKGLGGGAPPDKRREAMGHGLPPSDRVQIGLAGAPTTLGIGQH